MTKATPIAGVWVARYIDRDGNWRCARDARGWIIKCETEALALSVAKYRRRRLKHWRR